MIVVYDFDGVILDSDLLKYNIFKHLFINEKKIIRNKILEYHFLNQGINRKIKFKHISKNILKFKNHKKKSIELENTFKKLISKKILSCKFGLGAKKSLDFLKKKKIPCYVATGVKQLEIENIILKLKIKKYFKKIYGYPKKKENILRIIKQNEKVKYSSLYFVGDSISDLIAAQRRKVNFLGKKTNLNSKKIKNNKYFKEGNVYKLIKKVYGLNFDNK